MLNIIPIIVCAVPIVAALYLIWVWLDRGEDQLVRGDDPRADKSVDPVVKYRDYEEYPLKEDYRIGRYGVADDSEPPDPM